MRQVVYLQEIETDILQVEVTISMKSLDYVVYTVSELRIRIGLVQSDTKKTGTFEKPNKN